MILVGERSETHLSIHNFTSEASYVNMLSELKRQNCILTYATRLT